MNRMYVLLCFLVCVACSSPKSTTSLNKNDMQNSNSLEWINSTNVYEVNVRQYTPEGTFNAFLPHLSRLKEMGVKTLWFMPITPIAEKERKGTMGSQYAASDYTTINPEFGTMDDFKNLVKAAHAQGFKVIIDWVANHTGWDHRWTREHPDYYEHDSTGNFVRASGMDDIIESDFKNPALRRAMIDAMKFWIQQADIDGFRCDLAFWVELDFWKEAKAELQKTKPLFWLGELDPLEHPEYMDVFNAAYTWTWMHKTEEWYKQKEPIAALDSVLLRYQKAPGMKAWFTANHDENSWNGTEYEKYGEAAKALAVFSCTWPGLPLIYNGQELPNTKRLKFFEKDPIEWNGTYALQDFYKTLLNLHSSNPALLPSSAELRLHTSDDTKLFAFLRQKDEHAVLVILNLSGEDLNFQLPDERVQGVLKDVFSHIPFNLDHSRSFAMKAWDYLVLER